MKELSNWAILIIPVTLMITGINHANAKNAIEKLTSNKKSKSVDLGSKPEPTLSSQIPSGLKKHSIGIGVGQTFVAGDFSETGEDKITWDLLYNYSASHSFDLLTGFHFSKHEFQNKYTKLMGLTVGIKAKLYQFDAFSPYGVGGFGFYAPQVKRQVGSDTNNVIESEQKVSFGYHIGLGGDLRLNDRVTVGLLAQYHNPFDVKQDIGTEVEGRYYKLLITTFYTF
jgi:hypothetical protein